MFACCPGREITRWFSDCTLEDYHSSVRPCWKNIGSSTIATRYFCGCINDGFSVDPSRSKTTLDTGALQERAHHPNEQQRLAQLVPPSGIIQENFEGHAFGRQAWSARSWTPWWRRCARCDGYRFAGTVRPEFLEAIPVLTSVASKRDLAARQGARTAHSRRLCKGRATQHGRERPLRSPKGNAGLASSPRG